MSIDSDLNAFGAITASETREPSDRESDSKVTEALGNTDVENIDTILVDFEHLNEEAKRAQGLAIAVEKLNLDGKINTITAESLSSISKTILGTKDRKVAYTDVPTKTGFSYAVESMQAEGEAARTQTKHAMAELLTKVGKCSQGQLETLKADSRVAKIALASALAAFSEEFFTVNIRDVILNDGEINMEQVLGEDIVLSNPFYGDQSMFHGCQTHLSSIVLSKDTSSVARWMTDDKHYVVVDNSIIDVEQAVTERCFTNKSAFYPEDQARPTLGKILEAAGSTCQADYEEVLAAGVTEAVYLMQGYLNQDTEQIDPVKTLPEVMYLAKVASSMIRAFTASVNITKAATAVYTGVVQGTAGISAT